MFTIEYEHDNPLFRFSLISYIAAVYVSFLSCILYINTYIRCQVSGTVIYKLWFLNFMVKLLVAAQIKSMFTY